MDVNQLLETAEQFFMEPWLLGLGAWTLKTIVSAFIQAVAAWLIIAITFAVLMSG